MKKIDYASYFLDRTIILFFMKLMLVLFFLAVLAGFAHWYFQKQEVTSVPSEKMVVAYLKGLVRNPESFYIASLEYEKKNRYAKAIIEMKYAIALLEGQASNVQNANQLTCYRRRLAFLQEERLFYEGF
jgi:hypothetical protein